MGEFCVPQLLTIQTVALREGAAAGIGTGVLRPPGEFQRSANLR